MSDNTEEGPTPAADPGPAASEEGFSEEGRRWYEELKDEEESLAPWLNLEWTGKQMKVRRG